MIICCIKYPHQSKLTMNYKHVFVFFCYLSIFTIQVNSRRRRKISRFRKAAGGTFDFGCSCGNAEQGADRNKHNISRPSSPYDIPKFRSIPGSGFVQHKYKINTRSRIVGGYQPKTRPWMVLLELKHSNGKRNSQCGGSIINKVTLKNANLFEKLKNVNCFS